MMALSFFILGVKQLSSIDIEICVDSRDPDYVARSVERTVSAGARRIELCAEMAEDGLTPPAEHIIAARQAMGSVPGLICMIRPRGGDFVCSEDEINLMASQIRMASEAGANGVVLGILKADGSIDQQNLERLIGVAKECGLKVAFHRAFDATPDFLESLETLIETGVDRILTCGTAWGSSGTAMTGLSVLEKLVRRAGKQIEINVGGGVSPGNALVILSGLPVELGVVSLHAHSNVMMGGEVSRELVRALCQAVDARL
ncbi:MAG: copper homeostasis protein CutC [Endozoicomonas sp.]